jgi:hypothetical protein
MNVIKPIFIIVLLIIFKIKQLKKKIKKINIPTFVPDIIIGTGGYYGFYQLGICHYIMNHFNYTNKNIMGVSAGSWNNIIMSLTKEKANSFIKEIFLNIPNSTNIKDITKKLQIIAKKYLSLSDIDMKKINICVTEIGNSNMVIYKDFLTIEELCRCCSASSFVPLITYKDIIYFYKNKLSFDGGFIYKLYSSQFKKSLIIKATMFNRFKWHTGKSFVRPKYTFYELYLLGYHDATIHNTYLSTFF